MTVIGAIRKYPTGWEGPESGVQQTYWRTCPSWSHRRSTLPEDTMHEQQSVVGW
jgi:hypothetical protein